MRAQPLFVLLLETEVLDAVLLTQDLGVALRELFSQSNVLAIERQLLLLLANSFLLLLLRKALLLLLPLLLFT